MARNKKKSKTRKRIYTFLVILIIIGVVAFIGIKFLIEPYIMHKIQTELNINPDRLYDVVFDDVDLNIINASVKIENISVTPRDSARILLEKGLIRSLITAQSELLIVKKVNFVEFLKTKSVIIDQISVEDILINYLFNPKAKPTERKTSGKAEPIIPNKIKSISINSFEILRSNFTYSLVDKPDEPLFIIDSLSVSVDNISVTSESILQQVPLSFTNIDLRSRHISYTPLKFYTLSTDGIRFDVQDTSLTIKQFKLIPKYSKEEFNKQNQYNDDWFSISVSNIVLNGLNTDELLADNVLHINSILVEEPDIEIYRDKRLPDAPFKYKALINGSLNKISREFTIDTVKVTTGKLIYYEMYDGSENPGKVYFNPLYLTAYNVTNDSIRIENYPHLEMDISGKLMGKSDLNTHLSISLMNMNEYFTATGKLDAINASEFNPMVESLLSVSITSGNVKQAEFSFKATDDVSDGELILIYEDLKVEVLKQNKPDEKSGGLSAGANVLIRNNNLPEDTKYSTGRIHFERRKDKFIINYLWNSVKSGIISIVVPIADKNKKLDRQEKREQKQKDKNNP